MFDYDNIIMVCRCICMLFCLICFIIPYCILIFQPDDNSVFYSEEDASKTSVKHKFLTHRHAVYIPNKNYTAGDRRRDLLRLLENTTVVLFEEANIRPILTSGSLLGWLRNREPMILDDDHDCAFMHDDWIRLWENSSFIYHRVRRVLLTQHEIKINFWNSSWICARATHIPSGYFMDFFCLFPGIGKWTRHYAYRGITKGCQKENMLRGKKANDINTTDTCEEFPDKDGDGVCDAFHIVKDWHMFGFDYVVAKSEILPLQPVRYGGIRAWVSHNPYALAYAEFGRSVNYRLPSEQFFMYSRPSTLSLMCLFVFICLLCFFSVQQFLSRRIRTIQCALALLLTYHSTFAFIMIILNYIRSGMACVALISIMCCWCVYNVFNKLITKNTQNVIIFTSFVMLLWCVFPLWPIFEFVFVFNYERYSLSGCTEHSNYKAVLTQLGYILNIFF